jgi:hypothetical protein
VSRRRIAALFTVVSVVASLLVSGPATAEPRDTGLQRGTIAAAAIPNPPPRGHSSMWDLGRGVQASVSYAYQWLDKGKGWIFPGGEAMLKLETDGNLVIYDIRNGARIKKWTSGTQGHSEITQMLFQPDGNLVLYTAGWRKAVWDAGSWGRCPARLDPVIALQSDNNLVVYCHAVIIDGDEATIHFDPIWASNTTF